MADYPKPGSHVHLGDGREGKVVKHVEQNGFKSMVVKITKSPDKNQIGQTVGATPDGIKFAYKQPKVKKPRQPKPNALKDLKEKQLEQIPSLETQLTRVEDQAANHKRPYFKLSTRWIKSERANAKIVIGSHEITCDAAVTPKQQASGLQAYEALEKNAGLWFPQHARRIASFHMGQVSFPIDIIFIDNGRVAKIISNIQPRAMGSWHNMCTDVVEVVGGWCKDHSIKVGDTVRTPLNKIAATNIESTAMHFAADIHPDAEVYISDTNEYCHIPHLALWGVAERNKPGVIWLPEHKFANLHHEALTEIQEMIQRQESGDDASAPITAGSSYDILRTITEADKESENCFNEEPEFIKDPHFEDHRQAQENFRVKPQTFNEQPGEIDKRNPTERFKDHSLGDESTYGEDNPDMVFGGGVGEGGQEMGYSREDAHFTLGYDAPTDGSYKDYEGPAVRAGSKTAQVDQGKAAAGAIKLFDKYPPKFSPGTDNKLSTAIISDDTIAAWIDSLGFEPENADALRSIMFTDKFKTVLGDALVQAGRIVNFEVSGTEMIAYR